MLLKTETQNASPALAEDLKNEILHVENNKDGLMIPLAQELLYRFVRGNKDTTFSLQRELLLRMVREKCAMLEIDPIVEEVCGLLARNYGDPTFLFEKNKTFFEKNKNLLQNLFTYSIIYKI